MNDEALDAAARALAGRLTGMLTRIPDDPAHFAGQDGVDTDGGCALCAYANVAGSWPTTHEGTHCEDCHRSWVSKVEAHCARCHLQFTSNASADLHDPYCAPDAELTRKRLISARRGNGKPILVLRQRKHGFVFATWSPQGGDKPW